MFASDLQLKGHLKLHDALTMSDFKGAVQILEDICNKDMKDLIVAYCSMAKTKWIQSKGEIKKSIRSRKRNACVWDGNIKKSVIKKLYQVISYKLLWPAINRYS